MLVQSRFPHFRIRNLLLVRWLPVLLFTTVLNFLSMLSFSSMLTQMIESFSRSNCLFSFKYDLFSKYRNALATSKAAIMKKTSNKIFFPFMASKNCSNIGLMELEAVKYEIRISLELPAKFCRRQIDLKY
jgi:hypothetical protein